MEEISPNGCTCHFLHAGQVCISCRGRAQAAQEGHKCSKCGVGIFGDEEIPRRQCSNCYYEEIDKYTWRP